MKIKNIKKKAFKIEIKIIIQPLCGTTEISGAMQMHTHTHTNQTKLTREGTYLDKGRRKKRKGIIYVNKRSK
jgi:hypothetical protein